MLFRNWSLKEFFLEAGGIGLFCFFIYLILQLPVLGGTGRHSIESSSVICWTGSTLEVDFKSPLKLWTRGNKQ